MRRFIKVLLTILLTISFSGCSFMKKGPSDVVGEKLLEMKEKAPKEVAEQLETDYLEQEEVNTFYKKVLDFEYETVEEKIDGQNAEVTVKITTYPFGEKLLEAVSEAFTLAFSGASEEEITKLMYEKLLDVDEKTYSKKVKLSCTEKDGEWTVEDIEDNEELMDAIVGGMMSAAQQFDE